MLVNQATNLQTEGTGTSNVKVPFSSFSYALYKDKNGRVSQMPLEVGGDQITLTINGVAQPRP